MKASAEKARRLVAEADRLVRDAFAHLEPQGNPPTDLDCMNAEQLFSLASNAYVMGAIEYQRRERGEESLSTEEISQVRWLEQRVERRGTFQRKNVLSLVYPMLRSIAN